MNEQPTSNHVGDPSMEAHEHTIQIISKQLEVLECKTEKILESQQRIELGMARHQGSIRDHERRTAGLEEVVFGNGEPGLKGNVASLMETRTNMRWGIGALWGAIVSAVGWIVAFLMRSGG